MARRGTRGKRGASEGRRSERAPAAPRISGMTLTATATMAAVAAAVFAFAGVFASSSGGGDTSAIDDLGAALVLALTAPDPMAWDKNARTYKAQAAYVRRVMAGANVDLPGLPKGVRGKQSGLDHATAVVLLRVSYLPIATSMLVHVSLFAGPLVYTRPR